jgi:hypothetical protein
MEFARWRCSTARAIDLKAGFTRHILTQQLYGVCFCDRRTSQIPRGRIWSAIALMGCVAQSLYQRRSASRVSKQDSLPAEATSTATAKQGQRRAAVFEAESAS